MKAQIFNEKPRKSRLRNPAISDILNIEICRKRGKTMLHIDPNKTIYYKTLSDRVVEPRDPNTQLPPNYRWIRRGSRFHIIRRFVLYAARITAFFYCKTHGVQIENKELLKAMRYRGCFLYANYVHAPGDGLFPIFINGAKPVDTLVDPDALRRRHAHPQRDAGHAPPPRCHRPCRRSRPYRMHLSRRHFMAILHRYPSLSQRFFPLSRGK